MAGKPVECVKNGILKSVSMSENQSWETQLNYLYNQLGKDITDNDIPKVIFVSGSSRNPLVSKSANSLSFCTVSANASTGAVNVYYYVLKASGSTVRHTTIDPSKVSSGLAQVITTENLSSTSHASAVELLLYK